VAVEFALLLPIFLTLLLGAMDWGYFFFVQQLVTNASREGARTASLCRPNGGSYICPDSGIVDGFPQATSPETQAERTIKRYLNSAGLNVSLLASPYEDCTGLGVASTDAACVRAVYGLGGSLTGFLRPPLVPTEARAISVMRWQYLPPP
jgi:hypothetical protein